MGVCPREQNDVDDYLIDLAIAKYGSWTNVRAEYSDHFEMHENQWDEGWGWVRAEDRAFKKMLTSGYLLERGVGAFPEELISTDREDRWNKEIIHTHSTSYRDPISVLTVFKHIELSEDIHYNLKMSHAFVTDVNGKLFHHFEDLVDVNGVLEFQWVTEEIDPDHDPIKSIAVKDIVACVDDNDITEEISCGYAFRKSYAGELNPETTLWVLGRGTNGEMLVFYKKIYIIGSEWQVFFLSDLQSTLNPDNGGIIEAPILYQMGEASNSKIDLVVRSEKDLYHFRRHSDDPDPKLNWTTQKVNPDGTEVVAKPVGIFGNTDLEDLRVYSRNQHGALIEFVWSDVFVLITCLTCGQSELKWTMNNIDNIIAGVDDNLVISYPSVSGNLTAAKFEDNSLRVYQRNGTVNNRVIRYILTENGWITNEVWFGGLAGNELISDIEVLPDFLSGHSSWVGDLFLIKEGDELIDISTYNQGSGAGTYYDIWFNDNITATAKAFDDRTDIPQYPVKEGITATKIKYSDWVVMNVFALHKTYSGIVNHRWVDRAGFHYQGKLGPGWITEVIPDSNGTDSKPVILNYYRMMDVFGFDGMRFEVYRNIRDRPWHANLDYYDWASGKKHGFEYQPEDDNGAYASASGWPYWNADMKCPSFTNSRGPTKRASTMLHEATHLNNHYRGDFNVWKHEVIGGTKMDYWYGHSLFSTNPGSLDPEDDKHSMYQIQIEFCSDIAEFPDPELTEDVLDDVLSFAQSYMQNRIIDIPSWSPGEPRPF